MPNVSMVLICGLATFVPVFLFLETTGPFNIFGRWRKLMGITAVYMTDIDGNEEFVEWKESGSFTSKLFNCNRCLTPYIALMVILLYPSDLIFSLETVRVFIVHWLAISAIAIIAYEVLSP